MAWAYRRYLTDASIADAEGVARAARVGLWADPSPTAPVGLAPFARAYDVACATATTQRERKS